MATVIKPQITEKSYYLAHLEDVVPQYTFIVPVKMDKEFFKKVIEKENKVNILSIRAINLPGKKRTFKGIKGCTQPKRKMIITLKKGQTLPGFEVESDNKTEVKSDNKEENKNTVKK